MLRLPLPFQNSVIAALTLLVAASVPAADSAPLPPHPRLLLDAAGVAELKQRIATAPWAKAAWADLKSSADRRLGQSVELPPRGGNWSHNYVCPTHGARLSQGKQLGPWEWEHTCPVGKHVLRGDPSRGTLDFDGNAIAGIHGRLAQQVVEHGLVFQVTGDTRHASRARAILLAYAGRYLQYPAHNNQGRPGPGGRVASQSLSEAGWLTTFTQGADLVWTTLSEADRAAITDKVLRPALQESVLPRRLGIHNIQCHHNSAIGSVGFLLGDEALIAAAIDDPKHGYRLQMEKGVLADGMWTEGASGYHFYTIQGLWPLTEAARHCGRDLYGPRLRSMFDGPLALAMPDLVLPNFNDSGTVPLSSHADLYELAFARYTNAAYVPLLAGSDRRGRLALLYGAPTLPRPGQLPAPGSRNSPASGYAILQQGEGVNATWLCLKYGPHGGGHGHPDKNTFILYARGEILAPDAGTHAYGSPLPSGWDKSTFAHNTLVVDEASQVPATGKCLAFGTERGVDYAITEAGPAYAGVRFVRTAALLNSNLVVLVDQVQAAKTRTFDLVYHQVGAWADLPAGKPWTPPPVAGYKHFTDATVRASADAGLTFTTRAAANWQPAITLAGGEPGEIITGYGILKTTEDRVPLLVQRRRTQGTAFVWALSLDGTPVALRVKAVKDAAGQPLALATAAHVAVESAGRTWALLVNPSQQTVVATHSDGAEWRSGAAFAAKQ
jgi:hypothetical protein